MAMPAVPAMPTSEYSSAANTFSMSRWAIRFPMVARRSPAMMTPPLKTAATMVVACRGVLPCPDPVPCGSEPVCPVMVFARWPGSNSLAAAAMKSTNEDEPGAVANRSSPWEVSPC